MANSIDEITAIPSAMLITGPDQMDYLGVHLFGGGGIPLITVARVLKPGESFPGSIHPEIRQLITSTYRRMGFSSPIVFNDHAAYSKSGRIILHP